MANRIIKKINSKTHNTIDAGDESLKTKQIQQICEVLSDNQSVTSLDLELNNISKHGAIHIGQMLETNAHLQTLSLAFNKIGKTGTSTIMGALQLNHTLTELSLKGNGIGDQGATSIADVLKNEDCVIKVLWLGLNGISDVGAFAISDSLSTNGTLVKLGMAHNKIGGDGGTAIGQGLEMNSRLRELWM
eukprot:TRINITY_DN4692_c1_g1_i1.p1 TRINITY_DN4692_c1_g1~~TRINITY_DN4692_c1_g1_i1.p1  ORF type:complete len:189 (+),score=56.70 TRINITY_DN4692_c1_g1_i1:3-569(+)